jgi:DNA polymerase-3 subunit gamma/tau
MAGAMLLFDEINRKGFEGDLVVNGFAEFIRNLLVSKNQKAAQLLEVVEGLQSKYITTAELVSTAYLVSALNILNETEINYKMARNKRLHVELALIKLTFLQQAIDLTFDNTSDSIIKKKRVNGPVAYKATPLKSLQIQAPPSTHIPVAQPALFIEKKKELVEVPEPLKIYTAQPAASNAAIAEPKPVVNTGKKNLLQSLRDKHVNAARVADGKECINLEDMCLAEAWKEYTDQVKQHKAVFTGARLSVTDRENFSITVNSTFEEKVILQEKMKLLEFLHKRFHNTSIRFIIIVSADSEQKTTEPTMNTREKYLHLIEQYPLVKELKDRLKLELDY